MSILENSQALRDLHERIVAENKNIENSANKMVLVCTFLSSHDLQ